MMRLKHLELNGFKSFAKKTSLDFEHPIVCIVGPNGSGKSNVVEAFRFVLGEQSMKSMRGKGGKDLIFKGSKKLPQGSKASVSIYFDNSDKIFKLQNEQGEYVDLNYDNVSLKREVHKDGLNKYILNNSDVRLKDINSLLSSVHIGSSGHHIISQGEADRVLSANARDKKEMIEDALGLKVYQYKIREATRKLERSEENIKEVRMQKRENAPHLRFLERQVQKIEKLKELKVELAGLLGEYLQKESVFVKTEQEKHNEELGARKLELKDITQALSVIEEKEEVQESASIGKLRDLEKKLNETQRHEGELERKLGRTEGMIEVESYKKEQTKTQSKNISIERKDFESFVSEINEYLDQAVDLKDLDRVAELLEKLKNLVGSFSGQFEDMEEAVTEVDESKLEELKAIAKTAFEDLEILKQEKKNLEEQIASLKISINEEMASLRQQEKEKFALKVKQQELNSAIEILRVKIENIKDREFSFKEEIAEGKALLGQEMPEWENFTEAVGVNKADQDDLHKRIERIKIKLEDSGVGNSADILKEYEEVKERDEFLAKEIEDLEGGIESTQTLIEDLKEKLGVEFKEGVKKINKEFHEFFGLMFGGGGASIKLVEEKKRSRNSEEGVEKEEGETEEGIEINVSLPQKKVKELHSLSGGERSLTSIALLFAMSYVNPPPFLILDETDAALDEANSRKYGDMLEKLSKHSQLIVVTHNRETMSRAGVLYGVTIGSDGASKLLSVKFDEAIAVAK